MKYWYLSSFAHAKEILGYALWECKLDRKPPNLGAEGCLLDKVKQRHTLHAHKLSFLVIL